MQPEAFKDLMAHLASGVTVVTATDPAGNQLGLTATAVSSVSMEPPLLLFCLAKKSGQAEAFKAAEGFAVNYLKGSQENVSNAFASPAEAKWQSTPLESGLYNAPVMTDALAVAECKTQQVIDAGDHWVYLGHIEATRVNEGSALVYYNRAYHQVG